MKLSRWVVAHPWRTLGLLTLVTAFLIAMIPRIHVETDIAAALPKDLPVKRLHDLMGELFPSKDVIIVALKGEDVFTPMVVEATEALTERLVRIPGVYDALSPTNVSVILPSPEGIQVVPALEGDPNDPEVLRTFRERLMASDMVGMLVSRDQKALGILVMLKNTAKKREVARAVLAVTDSLRTATGLQIYATGRPVIEHLLALGLARDVHVFFTLVILVVILILTLSFRSFRGVLLPLTVVILSVLWTLGFMALVRIPFSHSTEFLPVLLISIGVAYGIHILHTFAFLRNRIQDKPILVLTTMERMNLPVTMSALTTAVAFLGLGVAGFVSLQQLGLSVAFGVMAALLLSLTFIPAMLVLLPLPKEGIGERRLGWLHRGMEAYGDFLVHHRWGVLTGVGLFLLLILAGYPRLKVENVTIENFPKNSPARIAYEIINRHFSGAEVVNVLVRGKGEGALYDPRLLQEMDRFKRYMLQDTVVGQVLSVADLVKRLHMMLHGGDPAYDRIPDSIVVIDGDTVLGRDLVAQYLALYSLSSRPGELERMVTPDFSVARMDLFLREGRRTTIKGVDERARAFIRRDFRHAIEVDLTGSPEILLTVNDMVVTGQLKSIVVSLILVFLLVTFAFRSPVAGLYGVLPIFFALFLNFGAMGWLGIYASLENMVTSNIAIGVGIDYMIHYIQRMRRAVAETPDLTQATRVSLGTTGVAILLNALAVALGFATIMASQFRAVSQMGFLISLAMLSTCFAAITLLPVLLVQLQPRFLFSWREGTHHET